MEKFLFLVVMAMTIQAKAVRESHGIVAMTPGFSCYASDDKNKSYLVRLPVANDKITGAIVQDHELTLATLICDDHYDSAQITDEFRTTVICQGQQRSNVHWILKESRSKATLEVVDVRSNKTLDQLECF